MYQSIITQANHMLDELVAMRRELHTMPEIAFHERKTSEYICRKLEELGIPYRKEVAKTGIVGLIEGAQGGAAANRGKTILLRADMDALPIQEQSGTAYASQNDGMMHACGHDAHVACLLGAAKILSGMRDQFNGNIKLMFQPAEEGVGGAEPMIQEGLLENPRVDAAVALHVETAFESGKIALKPGAVMSAPDEFTVTIQGKGGHGGYPHKAVDPILVAAKYIEAVQSINSRYISPTIPSVISVCMINAGSLYNIIPDSVFLKGTARAVDSVTREELPRLMERMLSGICAAMDATYTFQYRYMYPPLVNDTGMTALVEDVIRKAYGEDCIERMEAPFMGGEDFSYVANEVPSAYFFLGCRNEQSGAVHPLHSPHFEIDESCLPMGAAMLAMTATEYLEKENES